MKGGRGTLYGSIDKTGRMIIPHAVATLTDAKPGTYFELFVDPDESQILMKPVPYETAYSVKASCTGKLSAWNNKDASRRTPNLIVSVKTALTHVGITIVSRLRVPIDWVEDLGGYIVQLPRPETITSEIARSSSVVKGEK